MFNKANISILKYFVVFGVLTTLTACSDDDGDSIVFNPDVAPQNVQVVAGDDDSTDTNVQNTISWTRDPAATDYVVYWNNTGDDIDTSNGTQLAVADLFSNVVHTGVDVQKGNTYYYKVQALSGTQSSILSDQVAGTPQQSITGNNLNDVAWNGTVLVAVGDSGDVITSPNGTNDDWILRTSGVDVSLAGVTWANSQFVVVGAGLTVLTGDVTGTNWFQQDLENIISETGATAANAADLEDVAWVVDRYIAVGKNNTIITSTTGTAWTLQNYDADLDNFTLKGVAGNADGSKVVTVGTNGTLLTSNDQGQNWEPVTLLNETNDLNDVTWDGDEFIVVGSNDTIWTSSDGVDWERFNPQTSVTFVAVTQWDSSLPADPVLAAVGSAGDFVVTDDIAGVKIATGTNEQLSGITWVDNGVDPAYFVMVGHNGTVLTSRLH